VFGFLTDQELHGRADLVPHTLLAVLILVLAIVAARRTAGSALPRPEPIAESYSFQAPAG
jgi:hypothetical protein